MSTTSKSTVSTEADKEHWIVAPSGEYPYASPKELALPVHRDPYQRCLSSLLCSMGHLLSNILRNQIPKYKLNQYISFGSQIAPRDDIQRSARVCCNSMTLMDYKDLYAKFARNASQPRHSLMIHVDDIPDKTERRLMDDCLPRLSDYQHILISTTTDTGKIVLFLILPFFLTVDTYCTSPIQFEEVRDIVSKLLVVLRVSFSYHFKCKLRLQLQQNFHTDPVFLALFLAYQLNGGGKYLQITEELCLHFKLSLVSKFIDLHDLYLGQLNFSPTFFHLSYTFYTTAHENRNSFERITKKGWYPIDVEGDGNCGYYAMALGFRNAGIDTFEVQNIVNDNPTLRTKRLREKVVNMRHRFLEGSRELLRDVYKAGTPSRSASWWINCIGAYSDDTFDNLHKSFVYAEDKKQRIYFTNKFLDDEAYHEYQMNPYWSAMVAAYVFDIRVVVITRTTSPKKAIIEENHSPEPEQRPNTVENNDTQEESTKIDHLKEKKAEPEKQTVTEEDDVTPKLPMKVNHANEKKKKNKRKETEANITDELEYHYATRVFEFKENFKNEIDTFVPVTEKKGCYRLTDNHFNAKKTIELLYLTGYVDRSAEGTADDNHFLFLRRVFCTDMATRKYVDPTQLGTFLESEQEYNEEPDHNPPIPPIDDTPAGGFEANELFGTSPPHSPEHGTTNESSKEQSCPETTAQGARVPAEDSGTPTGERDPEELVVTPPPASPEHEGVAKVSVDPPLPADTTKKRKADTLQQSNFQKKNKSKDMEEEEENISLLSNSDKYDYMFDKKSGCFYKGIFNSKFRRYFGKTEVRDISEIDEETTKVALEQPNCWIAPGLGDAWDDPPPKHLLTTVQIRYPQKARPFCLTFCLASALYYCNFQTAGEWLASQAETISKLTMNTQLQTILGMMPNLVPTIGGATMFNARPKGNNRNRRKLDWELLFKHRTAYPTLVLPSVDTGGSPTHAFCVVDDLIFDASAPKALKLTMDSVKWIFQNQNVSIYAAYRFNMKVSPKGVKIDDTFTRSPRRNWSEETQNKVHERKTRTTKPNKPVK